MRCVVLVRVHDGYGVESIKPCLDAVKRGVGDGLQVVWRRLLAGCDCDLIGELGMQAWQRHAHTGVQ